MAAAKIQETTDYGQFKTKKGNRGISKGHVNRLVASIKEHNLLASNPIIVNSSFEVIDGQHRLTAAKILKTPIYFVVFNPASLHEIQLLNANVKAWNATDFLNSYITLNKPHYKTFKQMWEKWEFPFSATIQILSSPTTSKKGLHQMFREGKLEIADLGKSEEMAEAIERILKYAHRAVRHSNPFYYAVMRLYNRDRAVVEKLSEKVAAGIHLYRVSTISEYLREFEDILNKERYGKPIRLY